MHEIFPFGECTLSLIPDKKSTIMKNRYIFFFPPQNRSMIIHYLGPSSVGCWSEWLTKCAPQMKITENPVYLLGIYVKRY